MRLRGAGLPTGETRRLESRRYGAVGSWVVSYRFCACLGTRNCNEAAAGALASWTAAVLCRFCACGPDLKAPEDWRTPKPGGTAAGSWRGSLTRNVNFAVRFNHNFIGALRDWGDGSVSSGPKDLNSSGKLRSCHDLHRAVLRPIA